MTKIYLLIITELTIWLEHKIISHKAAPQIWAKFDPVSKKITPVKYVQNYHTRTIITRGLYIFYLIFYCGL